MNRPTRTAARTLGIFGLAAAALGTGPVQLAGASFSARSAIGAPAAAPSRSAGTGDLPTSVRTLVRHRLPDALRRHDVRTEVKDTVQLATNWSGEVQRGSDLSSVSAKWTVPAVVPSRQLQFTATWVGIGGFSGTTLIQAGTIEATGTGKVGYAAWVEVLPTPSLTLTLATTPGGSPSFTVAVGDVMGASVVNIGANLWVVTVADETAGWTYTHTFSYEVRATSAEWITERPTIYTTSTRQTVFSALADYGSVRFTDVSDGIDGGPTAPVSTLRLTPIVMEEGGSAVSAPGPVSVGAAGGSFTDSYLAVPTRIYGRTSDGTAAAELVHQFTPLDGSCPSSPTSSRAVVLATDKNFPDALASAYLASYLKTGTLLTSPSSLPATTLDAIRLDGITHVYLVGGDLAVSTGVVAQLESTPAYTCGGVSPVAGTAKVQVTRIAGATAYDTALDVAKTPGATPRSLDLAGAYAGVNADGGDGAYNLTSGTGSPSAPAGALKTAILATGVSFQDAEAASSLAYASHLPILLTTPSNLSAPALTGLETLHIRQVIVMGGPLAVSDAVVSDLQAHGMAVLRIAGADDTQTAIELAKLEYGSAQTYTGLGWAGTGQLAVARGDYYSDGLAGAVVAADGPAGSAPEPLLLTTSPTSMGNYLGAFLASAGTVGLGGKRVTGLTILGGPDAVAQQLANTLMVDLLG